MSIQETGSTSCQFCKAWALKQELSLVYTFRLISHQAVIDSKGGVTDPTFQWKHYLRMWSHLSWATYLFCNICIYLLLMLAYIQVISLEMSTPKHQEQFTIKHSVRKLHNSLFKARKIYPWSLPPKLCMDIYCYILSQWFLIHLHTDG